jgi:opacity protein-like surface antigen
MVVHKGEMDMRKMAVVLALFLCAGASPAWAQITPKSSEVRPRVEVGGGFALERSGGVNFTGWQVNAAGNLSRNIGVAGEVAGYYKNLYGVDTTTYTYLFGPRFSVRSSNATLFTHLLFGRMNSKVAMGSVNASDTFFAYAYGVGVDLNVMRRVAIRVAQFDVLYARVEGSWGRDFRYMAGVVFKVGQL